MIDIDKLAPNQQAWLREVQDARAEIERLKAKGYEHGHLAGEDIRRYFVAIMIAGSCMPPLPPRTEAPSGSVATRYTWDDP